MMPGDSHSKTVAIAADATFGNCQNCSVLHQTLGEYVSSFLALKQKITVSDDAIGLQQQLEELQIRLVTLETKTRDYESMQAELEEKKRALSSYGQISDEMEKLKQQKCKTVAENNKLEEQLRNAKELADTQSLENVQLKREKAAVENDLLSTQTALKRSQAQADRVEKLTEENNKLTNMNNKLEEQLRHVKELAETRSLQNAQLKREKAAVENDLLSTQTSLKRCQAQADQVEKLTEERTKLTNMKNNLENKVKELEDSAYKQNHHIAQQTKERVLLERNLDDLKVRLLKLERERIKEYRSVSTQANSPKEHKVDKEKIQMLLKDLWACVEPQQQLSENKLHLTGDTSLKPYNSCKQTLPSSPQKTQYTLLSNMPHGASDNIADPYVDPLHTEADFTQLKTSPCAQKAIKHQGSPQDSGGKKRMDKKSKRLSREHKTTESSTELGIAELSVEEIMKMFKQLTPCLSPIPNLDIEMENMETDDGEKVNCPKPCEVFLQQEVSVHPTTSVSHDCPNQTVLQTEENGDMTVVSPTQEEHISDENDSRDLAQNQLVNRVTEIKDKGISTDSEELKLQRDMQTEQEPATLQDLPALSSSSFPMSDKAVEVEVVLTPDESQDPACTGNPSIGISTNVTETPNVLGEAKLEQLEMTTKIDVDTGLSDAVSAIECTPVGVSDTSVHTEEAGDVQPVTSTTFIDSIKDAEESHMENGSDIEKSQQDSYVIQGSQEITVIKAQKTEDILGKDTEQEKHCASSISDSFNGVSNELVAEKVDSDDSINHPVVENSNEEQRTERVDDTHSSPKCHSSSRPEMMEIEDVDKGHTNQEKDQSDPQKTEAETLNTEIIADNEPPSSDSPKSKTIGCKSSKESPHSLCGQSTVKLQVLEAQPGINTGSISSNNISLQPVPSLPEEGIVKGSPQENIASSHTTSLNQTSTMNGQNICSETCTRELEKQEEAANPAADTDALQPPQCIGEVRSEMGPPLPPLLTPLRTPPKAGKSISPRQAIGKLSFPSPMDRPSSPTTPVRIHKTPTTHHLSSSTLNSPLPSNGVPSSPLQFGSATPKHAVPVPGRLPITAMNSSPSSSSSPSQENSMRILDSMYPDLSARARTLSILRGNVGLSICSSDSGTLPRTTSSQMSGFKTINSTSTAFTKTEMRGEKRQAVGLPQPNDSKCRRLDCFSPTSSHKVPSATSQSGEDTGPTQRLQHETPSSCKDVGEPAEKNLVVDVLKKIEKDCFDLLPVIQSHLYVGALPKKPVLRDEEREVISEICHSSLINPDDAIMAILNKLKAEKRNLSGNYMQALCRVYTGVCRQRSDWEKAHILAYSVLTEDFPDSAKLILFMVTTWPSLLSQSCCLCQAIHAVTKLKAQEGLLSCLSAFLGWEKNPPRDVDQLISTALSDLRTGSDMSFVEHSRYGHDLGTLAWEHVFTLNLLCTHKKWKWTFEQLLRNELWPLMNTWVVQPRNQQEPISDATVATVLRLIGRLCQLGLKEKCVSSVVNVARDINMFCRHGQNEGVPWEVQLAAVYCICELSPCNPKEALDALAEWRGEASQRVPPAVTSCFNQLASICRQIKS